MLECCAPLHDIGNAALPDSLLKKPGQLTIEERLFMQTHTSAGADTLEKVARKHGLVGAFLPMALDVIRHHHERFDGRGYPDRLAGDAIPLAARIVAIADVYDAPALAAVLQAVALACSTVEVMMNQSPGQFDPFLLQMFNRCNADFERIFPRNAGLIVFGSFTGAWGTNNVCALIREMYV